MPDRVSVTHRHADNAIPSSQQTAAERARHGRGMCRCHRCDARQKPSSRFARVFVLVVIEVNGKHIKTEKQALAQALADSAISEKSKQFACGAVTVLIHLFARLAMGHPEGVPSRRQVAWYSGPDSRVWGEQTEQRLDNGSLLIQLPREMGRNGGWNEELPVPAEPFRLQRLLATGMTPFLRITLPYFLVSPVCTMANASVERVRKLCRSIRWIGGVSGQ